MLEFDQLKQIIADAEDDVAKAESGNKAAGTRVRKAMQDIKNAAQDIRKKVLEFRGDSGSTPPAGGM
ncbi:MAG: histone H1 [Phycisphaera sp.]|nr:histone H1 [Phycisphaera sp.]